MKVDLTFISGWSCDTHAALMPPVFVQDATLPCPYCHRDSIVRMPGEMGREFKLVRPGDPVELAPIWYGVWARQRIGFRNRIWTVWEFKGIQ